VSDEGAAVGARALRQGRVGEIIAVVLGRDAERGAGGQIECRVYNSECVSKVTWSDQEITTAK